VKPAPGISSSSFFETSKIQNNSLAYAINAKFVVENIARLHFIEFPGIAVLVHKLSNPELERSVQQENRNNIVFDFISHKLQTYIFARGTIRPNIPNDAVPILPPRQ
jgi:hypothetical protein